MLWYENLGCIALGGRLMFVRDRLLSTEIVLAQAVKEQAIAKLHPLNEACGVPFPANVFCAQFYFDLHADPTRDLQDRYHIFNQPAGLAVQQRTWPYENWGRRPGSMRPWYGIMNEINPAFLRLQRWFQTQAAKLLAKRKLAFMMGSHGRLGNNSGLCQLDTDLLCQICRCVFKRGQNT